MFKLVVNHNYINISISTLQKILNNKSYSFYYCTTYGPHLIIYLKIYYININIPYKLYDFSICIDEQNYNELIRTLPKSSMSHRHSWMWDTYETVLKMTTY